jgi:predicted TIM-barrel fold metal-dependent hydrolase
MNVFDVHTHYFPEQLAQKALACLVENSGVDGSVPLQPCYNGTRSGLIRLMQQSGITRSMNLPVATKACQVDSINQAMVNEYQSPIYNFGAIHPDTPDKRSVLTFLQAHGILGVKLHPEYQDFELEDCRVVEIYEICQELGLIILFHSGKDGSYLPPYHSSPKRLLAIKNAYPQLKFIGGHFGGLRMWDEVEEYLIGQEIYLDTSIFLETCPRDQVIRMLENHPSDYILFGSDAPWGNPMRSLQILLGLPISPALKKKICWQNSMQLLGLS